MQSSSPAQLGRLWAASPQLRALFERVRAVARAEAPVIIEGETGTGKELVAEALHSCSERAGGPFVVVDCAALPAELIESELFGHVRGAFTGAVDPRQGAFLAAEGGTIFIDELGELPLAMQPRLLRVLEKREVKPVGSNKTRKTDVRVVAATNRRLTEEIAAGRFREDLYHRLRVFSLEIPPLRERPEDIDLLAERFLAPLRELGQALELSEHTRARLHAHPWPGNVRELKNVIERGAALSDRRFRLPQGFGEVPAQPAPSPAATPAGPAPGERTRPLWEGLAFKEAKARVLEDFERGYLSELLRAHGGNVSAAAREAGIHRNVFHRMLRRLELEAAVFAGLSPSLSSKKGPA